MSSKSPTALKTIGELSIMLDVPQHVLRFWETKFKQINPQKSKNRRYYRPQDIEILTTIKSLLYVQGYTIKGVTQYLLKNKKSDIVEEKIIKPEPIVSEIIKFLPQPKDLTELKTLLTNLENSKKKLLSIK